MIINSLKLKFILFDFLFLVFQFFQFLSENTTQCSKSKMIVICQRHGTVSTSKLFLHYREVLTLFHLTEKIEICSHNIQIKRFSQFFHYLFWCIKIIHKFILIIFLYEANQFWSNKTIEIIKIYKWFLLHTNLNSINFRNFFRYLLFFWG